MKGLGSGSVERKEERPLKERRYWSCRCPQVCNQSRGPTGCGGDFRGWRGDEGEAPSTETFRRLSSVSWFLVGFQLYCMLSCPEGTVSAVHRRLFGGEGAGRQCVQREQSCLCINIGSGVGGDKMGVPAQSEGGECGSSPHLLSLCPGRDGKAGEGRDTAPPPGKISAPYPVPRPPPDIFCYHLSPQTSSHLCP